MKSGYDLKALAKKAKAGGIAMAMLNSNETKGLTFDELWASGKGARQDLRHIAALVGHPTWRNRGLKERIKATLIEYAKKHGIKIVTIEETA